MTKQKIEIELARAYDEIPQDNRHYRVLIDRVWPRGVKKEDLSLDVWAKQLAPSKELRQWFDHDPKKWDEFRERYFDELDDVSEKVSEIIEESGKRTILLIYGTKDEAHNQAVALKEWIENHDVG